LAARERNGGIFGEVTINSLDPMVIIAALASASEQIGLAASYSTTYHDPYLLASKIASIDHLSKGRAAWNVVTTDASAGRNFSDQGHPDKDLRYATARETIDIVRALWDSWPDAALIADKAKGVFYDPTRVRPLDFQGKWNAVRGPLNLPRPPQGWPVFIQAGMSETGMDFAAYFAEVIFCQASNKEQGQTFRSAMRAKAQGYGRDPDGLKIMPGLSVRPTRKRGIKKNITPNWSTPISRWACSASASTWICRPTKWTRRFRGAISWRSWNRTPAPMSAATGASISPIFVPTTPWAAIASA